MKDGMPMGDPKDPQFVYDQLTKYDTHYSTARTAAVTILFTLSGFVTTQLIGKANGDVDTAIFGWLLLTVVLVFVILLSMYFQQHTDACLDAQRKLVDGAAWTRGKHARTLIEEQMPRAFRCPRLWLTVPSWITTRCGSTACSGWLRKLAASDGEQGAPGTEAPRKEMIVLHGINGLVATGSLVLWVSTGLFILIVGNNAVCV